MADTSIDFPTSIAATYAADLIYRLALCEDPRIWRAVEAFQRGEYVTVTVNGDAIGGYPSPLQSATLEC